MKGFLGVVVFCVTVALSICLISCGMCFAGFGVPNCEPTTYGYAEFYTMLFGCSFGACFGAWGLIALACVVDNFISKGK